MGWLGYFIGKSKNLHELNITRFEQLNGNVVVPFFNGVSRNRSITKLALDDVDLLNGSIFTALDPFFEYNKKLVTLSISHCDWGDEGSRLLALALSSCKNSSLTKLFLVSNNFEGVDIITALSMHRQLQEIDFEENLLRKKWVYSNGNVTATLGYSIADS